MDGIPGFIEVRCGTHTPYNRLIRSRSIESLLETDRGRCVIVCREERVKTREGYNAIKKKLKKALEEARGS